MARADFMKRLEILKQLYAPAIVEPLTFSIAVCHLVNEDDQLLGTWREEPDTNSHSMPATHYYGRDMIHIDELKAQRNYLKEEVNDNRHICFIQLPERMSPEQFKEWSKK